MNLIILFYNKQSILVKVRSVALALSIIALEFLGSPSIIFARTIKCYLTQVLSKYLIILFNNCIFYSYAASFVLERQSGGTFDDFYEAGRRGRSGVDCRQMYLQCNEV